MSPWSEDFSELSLDEVLRSQDENRAWGKELRRKTNVLVNNRLAKNITQDDYLADRKVSHEDTAEYRRRAAIIDAQIVHRTQHSMTRES